MISARRRASRPSSTALSLSLRLFTNEECTGAIDMGNFYRVPCDKRGLNYDKYFNQGDTDRNPLTEFNSNNTKLLTVEETKAKIASLSYIQEELAKMEKNA